MDHRDARTVDKGHGRLEVRHLLPSTDLDGYIDRPGLAQALRGGRPWWVHGERKYQTRCGITSLPLAVSAPRRLLAFNRGHWLTLNQAHRSKDVNLDDDASLMHADAGPTILGLLRDPAISVLRSAGCSTIAARLRRDAQYLHEAVALITAPLPTHA